MCDRSELFHVAQRELPRAVGRSTGEHSPMLAYVKIILLCTFFSSPYHSNVM